MEERLLQGRDRSRQSHEIQLMKQRIVAGRHKEARERHSVRDIDNEVLRIARRFSSTNDRAALEFRRRERDE